MMLWTGFWFAYDQPLSLEWGVIGGCVIAGMIALIVNNSRYFAVGQQGSYKRGWIVSASLIALFSGSVVGTASWFLLDLTDISKVYLVTALTVLPIFGSAVVAGTLVSVHNSWTFGSTLPLFVLLGLSGNREYQIMAAMLLFTGVPSALLMNLYFRKLFDQSIQLKHENLALLDDVRSQKQRAEHANIEKSRFLAATSHDLRQPLHALDLFLDALDLQLVSEGNRELLGKARLSSQALGELLNALLDISRFDAGAVQADLSHFDLGSVVSSVVSAFDREAGSRGIEIKTELVDVIVFTDAVLLARMIRNLLSNAVKHNRQCKIIVRTVITGDGVIMEVTDTGKGIAKEELSNIFSEFYQLENPNRDRSQGLGLGLAIVSRLSTLLDIPVSVDSELGCGSTFSLRLMVDEGDISQINTPPELNRIDLTGVFIVVIDDEYIVRDAVRAMLRSWNCEVLSAESCSSMLTELTDEGYPVPELIISDYRLAEDRNGFDAIKRLRGHYQQQIPAIIMTGDSSNKIIELAEQSDCRVMLKPVGGDRLREAIEIELA